MTNVKQLQHYKNYSQRQTFNNFTTSPAIELKRIEIYQNATDTHLITQGSIKQGCSASKGSQVTGHYN